jgi:hypothetical protein
MKYEIGSVTENQTKSGGVWKGVACEEEQFSASRRTISIHDASRSQNAIARIGQEGDRCFTFDLYVNSQSDREKYIIKNNAFAISRLVPPSPLSARHRLLPSFDWYPATHETSGIEKPDEPPFGEPRPGIGHWK